MKLSNVLKQIFNFPLILLIKVYKYLISPMLPNACRYEPTCSVYFIAALQKYGPIKGFYLGVRRILRCNPWGGHGYDPLK